VGQTGALGVTGETGVTATGQTITLTQVINDFQGAVSLSGAATQITDANALTMTLATTGATTLSAGGNLTLSGTVSGATSDLTTTSTGATSFGATAVGGDLTVTSAGAVSQIAALSVTGATDVNATGQAITLTQAGNDFEGPVSLSGRETQLANANALTVTLATTGVTSLIAGGNLAVSGTVSGTASDLTTTSTGATSFGATRVDGSLTLTRSSAVSQSASLVVTGDTNIAAGAGTVTLTDDGNHFGGVVRAQARSMELRSAGWLSIDLRAEGDVQARAAQDLRVLVDTGGRVALIAGRDVAPLDAASPVAVTADDLWVEATGDIGTASHPLSSQVSALTARSQTGAIHVREADDLVLVDEGVVAAGSGAVEITAGGSLVMQPASRVDAAASSVTLRAGADVALARVAAGGGPIRVESGGAVFDGSQGQAPTNFSTPDRVSLKAERGIGGTGVALLRTEATRVEAVNGDLGDVMIGARNGLEAVGQGFRNDAPKGWIALLTESGRIQPGVVQSRSGQWVLLVGRTTVEASDLILPSMLESVSTTGFSAITAPAASSVVQETSAVLQVGLEAVKRGLLSQDGQLPLIAVMAASDSLQTAQASMSVREVAPAPAPVSSALESVSASRPASEAVSSLTGRGERESRREAEPAASAPASSQPPAAQPAAATPAQPGRVEPAEAVPAIDAQPSPPVEPVAPDQPADAAAQGETAPVSSGEAEGEDKRSAEPPDEDASAPDESAAWGPHDGTRHRWASLYTGWVERIGRWLNRQAPGSSDPAPVSVASVAPGGDGDLHPARITAASDLQVAAEGSSHRASDRPTGDEPRA
jgi:hypothetical protein